MAGVVRVTNVVATAQLGCDLDLCHLERTLPMALYTPKRFSALLIRIVHPSKAHCQVYRNGKMTINGGKTLEEARHLANVFTGMIKKAGYPAVLASYTIVNLIGSLDMGRPLHLEEISHSLKASYSPELFCGLRVRLSFCSAVIFHSGKVNLLGAKNLSDLETAEVELNILL